MENRPKIYQNKPQTLVGLIDAPETVAVWGRGTGKTTGLICPRTLRCVFEMPRSLGGFVASSFSQLLTKTLNEFEAALSRYGYVRDRDYVFGKYAPKKWNWPRPLSAPLKPDYFIHFRNGSGIVLISQDRPGSANGLNLDWIIGDEAKFLNRERYEQEVVPAIRGNRATFGAHHLHHSTLLVTDMPTSKAAQWILEKEDQHNTPQMDTRRELILATHLEAQQIKKEILHGLSPKRTAQAEAQVRKLNEQIRQLRKGNPDQINNRMPALSYFSEASSWDNLDVLGVQYFEKMRRSLTDLAFRTSICNERLVQITDGFYPDLSEQVHGYDAYDYNFIESADQQQRTTQDSRHDSDVAKTEPLDLAFDYGASFNCLVVGQLNRNTYHFLRSMFVKHPKKLSDLVADFKAYYRHHPKKVVRFYYDHTAKGRSGLTPAVYYLEVIECLRREDKHGSWTVIPSYIGRTSSYPARYEFWAKLLRGSESNLPRFRYNRTGCQDWAQSCMLAPIKEGRTGLEKNKQSERPNRAGTHENQERATHLSDAGDTLIMARIAPLREQSAGGGAGAVWG